MKPIRILIAVSAHNPFMHVLSPQNVNYCILTFTLDLNNSIELQKGPSEAAQSSQEGRAELLQLYRGRGSFSHPGSVGHVFVVYPLNVQGELEDGENNNRRKRGVARELFCRQQTRFIRKEGGV